VKTTSPFRLDGRSALVTGCGSDAGIGFASALLLAELGARVTITSTTERIEMRAAELRAAGAPAVHAHVADLTDPAQARALVAAAEAANGPLDVLVNNAGLAQTGIDVADALFAELPAASFRHDLELNLLTSFHATQAALPGMLERGYGRIVNVGSVAAHTGNPTNHHYAAAKAALTSLGRSLNKEYAPAGITINTIAPGLIDNAFHVVHTPRPVFDELVKTVPAARAGTNEDIAAAVAFLVSEAAGYISGETLHVNGGLYVS
jgi:3-oxoacyl-[acyl-carrier protein] reductase